MLSVSSTTSDAEIARNPHPPAGGGGMAAIACVAPPPRYTGASRRRRFVHSRHPLGHKMPRTSDSGHYRCGQTPEGSRLASGHGPNRLDFAESAPQPGRHRGVAGRASGVRYAGCRCGDAGREPNRAGHRTLRAGAREYSGRGVRQDASGRLVASRNRRSTPRPRSRSTRASGPHASAPEGPASTVCRRPPPRLTARSGWSRLAPRQGSAPGESGSGASRLWAQRLECRSLGAGHARAGGASLGPSPGGGGRQ